MKCNVSSVVTGHQDIIYTNLWKRGETQSQAIFNPCSAIACGTMLIKTSVSLSPGIRLAHFVINPPPTHPPSLTHKYNTYDTLETFSHLSSYVMHRLFPITVDGQQKRPCSHFANPLLSSNDVDEQNKVATSQ